MPSFSFNRYSAYFGGLVGADPKHVSVYGNKEDQSPLYSIAQPMVPGYFPTRVCILLFITRLYGTWPPPGLEDEIARIRECFPLHPRWELHIWADEYVAQEVVDAGYDPNYLATFQLQEADLEAMCLANADINFNWRGVITGLGPLAEIDAIMDAFMLVA